MDKEVDRNDIRCTAFHEAGHAVAAVVLEIPFQRVWINIERSLAEEREGTRLGSVERATNNLELAGRVDKARDEVIQILAGPIGETRAYPNLQAHLHQDTNDVQRAIATLKFAICKYTLRADNKVDFDPRDVASQFPLINEIMQDCIVASENLLSQHNNELHRIAAQLIAIGELSFDEIRDLCSSI